MRTDVKTVSGVSLCPKATKRPKVINAKSSDVTALHQTEQPYSLCTHACLCESVTLYLYERASDAPEVDTHSIQILEDCKLLHLTLPGITHLQCE